jgi:DNA-binding winged helix-turn-helix (wHTH) protein
MPYRFGKFTADEHRRQLMRDGCEVHLSPRAFDLLITLLQARPRALSKTELHATLWPNSFVTDANLSMLVAEIRRALGDAAPAPRFVRTVQRHGYAFQADATEIVETDVDSSTAGLKYWVLLAGRQILLQPGENIVGRDPGVQVWLDSNGVSRRHARIMVDGDVVTIEDLKSKNGTSVAGTRLVERVRLGDGDEIRFGATASVMFRVWNADQTTSSEASST